MEFLVDTVAAYIAEVVALVREEEVLNHFAGRGIIGRLCVAELTIDINDGFLLRVGGILLEGIENDGVLIVVSLFVLANQKDVIHTRFENPRDIVGSDFLFAVNEHFVTFDGNNFAGILVYIVFNP